MAGLQARDHPEAAADPGGGQAAKAHARQGRRVHGGGGDGRRGGRGQHLGGVHQHHEQHEQAGDGAARAGAPRRPLRPRRAEVPAARGRGPGRHHAHRGRARLAHRRLVRGARQRHQRHCGAAGELPLPPLDGGRPRRRLAAAHPAPRGAGHDRRAVRRGGRHRRAEHRRGRLGGGVCRRHRPVRAHRAAEAQRPQRPLCAGRRGPLHAARAAGGGVHGGAGAGLRRPRRQVARGLAAGHQHLHRGHRLFPRQRGAHCGATGHAVRRIPDRPGGQPAPVHGHDDNRRGHGAPNRDAQRVPGDVPDQARHVLGGHRHRVVRRHRGARLIGPHHGGEHQAKLSAWRRGLVLLPEAHVPGRADAGAGAPRAGQGARPPKLGAGERHRDAHAHRPQLGLLLQRLDQQGRGLRGRPRALRTRAPRLPPLGRHARQRHLPAHTAALAAPCPPWGFAPRDECGAPLLPPLFHVL
mmetsp:Transcript_10627/g.27309  ORF Transcript_10627/g.27309 Transcript_10627/m.27309 type:complete len:467 (-) Transcript_10627:55-1455(-)